MIRATASAREKCRALTASSQRTCGNRARFRLVWTFPGMRSMRQLSRADVCGKHHRPMARQLQEHGITVARKAFAQVRA